MTTPFGRPTFLVASMQLQVTHALNQFTERFLDDHLIHSFPGDNANPLRCVEDLHARLDALGRNELFDTVCLVDLINERASWDITCPEEGMRPSELVLRYPGVYWIFLVRDKASVSIGNKLAQELHFVELCNMSHLLSLLKRHAGGFRSWFDPTGLRSTVRGESLLCKYGAAIDDEVGFSVLNGYVLYLNNFSTYVISTFSEMKNVLDANKDEKGCDLSFLMEDVELNFSDLEEEGKPYLFTSKKEGKIRGITKVLEKRRDRFNTLQNTRRIFVSSVSDIPSIRPNDSFVTKPYGGMYAKELGPLRSSTGKKIEKYYSVPPSLDGHSVGDSRAQQVAAGLLERAKQTAPGVCTMEAAIHVALMALDARKLLRGECLSLSLEALALQHRMEVIAECTFIGSASQLAVKERLGALSEDVKKIVGDKKYSSHQVDNALVKIAGDIRRTYSDFDQFIEEDEAIIRLRTYEWRVKYLSRQPGYSNRRVVLNIGYFLKLIFSGVPELYFNHVVGRLWKMGLWIVVWIVVFAFLYSGLNITEAEGVNCNVTFHEWLLHSAANFLAPGSGVLDDIKFGKTGLACKPSDPEIFRQYWYVSLTEMFFGFVHLGIFISYLFQKISRR